MPFNTPVRRPTLRLAAERPFASFAIVAALVVARLSTAAVAATDCVPGFADPSFGQAGWVSAPVAGLAAPLADGRIVVVGQTSDRYDSFRLAHLDRVGALPP